MFKIPALTLIVASMMLLQSCQKSGGDDSIVPAPNLRLVVKGRAVDCGGANVKEGIASIVLNNGALYYATITNGNFSTTLTLQEPASAVNVCATDYNSLKYSDTARVAVSGDSVYVGTINSCVSNVPEYFRYKIDTTNYVFVPNVEDSLLLISWNYTGGEPMTTFLRRCYYNCGYAFEMQYDGHSVGTFAVTGRNRLLVRRYYSFNMPATGSITYTAYGNVGQYVTGSLSVPFLDNIDSLNHLFTGDFKLRRTQ